MTDRTPSTEAGRNAFIDLERDPPPQSRQYWDATILAIEAEGRQQAVPLVLAAVQEHLACACGGIEGHLRTRGLTGAVGLNASESPNNNPGAMDHTLRVLPDDTFYCLKCQQPVPPDHSALDASESPPPDDDDLASHLAVAMVEAGNPSQYKFIGEHAKAIVKALRRQQSLRLGDASESGQPPEASDE